MATQPLRENGYKLLASDNTAFAGAYGVKGDGVTNDTVAAQAMIDALAASGGGCAVFPHGDYLITGLVLKSGVHLLGGESHGYNESSITCTRFIAASTGIILDTPGGGCTAASVTGINFVGLGAGTACKGIRVQGGNWNKFERLEITNMADEGFLLTAGLANSLEDILAINCVLNRTRAGITGAIDIAGADNYLNRVEASTSQVSTVTSSNLYCVAIAIRGTNNMLSNCVGEISDQGYWIGTGTWNRLTNCRADLNFGHGFRVASGGNCFSSCQATRNSQDTDNTYNGFELDATTAQGNKFAACISSGLAADAKWPKWGFDDNATYALAEARNTFVGCGGQNNRTNLWNLAASATASGIEQPPHLVVAADADATPSIEGSSFLGLYNYVTLTSLTNFTKGVNGQTLWVIGSSKVTLIYNGGQLITNTGANKKLRDNTIYCFKLTGAVWRELSPDQLPVMVLAAQDVASTGASTTLATLATPTAGTYRVSIVVSAHTNNDTVTATIAYTDAVEAFATTLTPISAVALVHDSNTGTVSAVAIIRASNATSIIVTLSVTAQTTTKATAIIERIN